MLRIPVQLIKTVASRLAARTIRSALLPGDGSDGLRARLGSETLTSYEDAR